SDVLLAASERAPYGPTRALRQLRRNGCVVAWAVLRAEAAAHRVAHDADLVRRQSELLRHVPANTPDVLRRDVDRDSVLFPVADRLMRLHCVVQDDLRSVLGLDEEVGFRDSAVVVATLVRVRPVVRVGLLPDRLVRVEQRLEYLPVDRDARG